MIFSVHLGLIEVRVCAYHRPVTPGVCLCMCVCVSVYVCVCLWVCLCVYVCAYLMISVVVCVPSRPLRAQGQLAIARRARRTRPQRSRRADALSIPDGAGAREHRERGKRRR